MGLLFLALVAGCAWVLLRAFRSGFIWGVERLPAPASGFPFRLKVVSRTINENEFWRWMGYWVILDHVLLVLAGQL